MSRQRKVLRQPALVKFIQTKIDGLAPDLRNEPLVKDMAQQLVGIQKLVSFPSGNAPSPEDVRKLNDAVTKLMGEIQNKGDAK